MAASKVTKDDIKMATTGTLPAFDLLKLGDYGRKKPWLNYYWPQIIGVFLGTAAGCFINYQTRRPAFSGIQKHIVVTAGLTLGLTYVQKKRDEYYEEKDAVLRHYIELHPEDFVQTERVKIADILEPWVPVR